MNTQYELDVLVRDYGDVYACGTEIYRDRSLTVIGSLHMPKAETPSSKNEAVRQAISIMLDSVQSEAEVTIYCYNWNYPDRASRRQRTQLIARSKGVNVIGCERPTNFQEKVKALELLAYDAVRRASTVITEI